MADSAGLSSYSHSALDPALWHRGLSRHHPGGGGLFDLLADQRSHRIRRRATSCVFLLLGVALLIALGFEFVNGFHDTANAVATVIYTHSLPAYVAVVWSGMFNFLGVLLSSGAVAFGIISLLPVELILQVGTHAGFAMVFALLIAAIIWNLGTWYLGPALLELPYPDRLDHRRRADEPDDGLGQYAAPAASIGIRRSASANPCCSPRSSASSPPACCSSSARPSSAFPRSIRRPRVVSRRPCGSADCSS